MPNDLENILQCRDVTLADKAAEIVSQAQGKGCLNHPLTYAKDERSRCLSKKAPRRACYSVPNLTEQKHEILEMHIEEPQEATEVVRYSSHNVVDDLLVAADLCADWLDNSPHHVGCERIVACDIYASSAIAPSASIYDVGHMSDTYAATYQNHLNRSRK